jgi:hypothetical protein
MLKNEFLEVAISQLKYPKNYSYTKQPSFY